uniref:F-box domain-containing protein n=1 Tax=Mycena chlorophos TaxID=658473 RepID=A0ABQ0L0B1_MYCCL|nr:predicted protein [Mycena chlorophos]
MTAARTVAYNDDLLSQITQHFESPYRDDREPLRVLRLAHRCLVHAATASLWRSVGPMELIELLHYLPSSKVELSRKKQCLKIAPFLTPADWDDWYKVARHVRSYTNTSHSILHLLAQLVPHLPVHSAFFPALRTVEWVAAGPSEEMALVTSHLCPNTPRTIHIRFAAGDIVRDVMPLIQISPLSLFTLGLSHLPQASAPILAILEMCQNLADITLPIADLPLVTALSALGRLQYLQIHALHKLDASHVYGFNGLVSLVLDDACIDAVSTLLPALTASSFSRFEACLLLDSDSMSFDKFLDLFVDYFSSRTLARLFLRASLCAEDLSLIPNTAYTLSKSTLRRLASCTSLQSLQIDGVCGYGELDDELLLSILSQLPQIRLLRLPYGGPDDVPALSYLFLEGISTRIPTLEDLEITLDLLEAPLDQLPPPSQSRLSHLALGYSRISERADNLASLLRRLFPHLVDLTHDWRYDDSGSDDWEPLLIYHYHSDSMEALDKDMSNRFVDVCRALGMY